MSAAEEHQSASNFNILAIDLESPNASAQFEQSLRETGFAVLKNHTISQESIDELCAAWQEFFDGTEIQAHNRENFEGGFRGFFPFRSENAKDSEKKDLKQFYHFYLHNKDILPDLPGGLLEKTERFYNEMSATYKMLLGWLDKEMPEEVRERLSVPLAEMPGQGEKDQTLLRILDYPALDGSEEQGSVRAAEHEDINLLTLLVAGSEPGLQAKDTEGNWHDVPCDAGYITVNAGDMLKRATWDYYPSTPHRVVNPEQSKNVRRNSFPVFGHAAPEIVIDKRPESRITAGEFLNQRLAEIGLREEAPDATVRAGSEATLEGPDSSKRQI